MISLEVNGRTHAVEVDPDTPLLWVLRDQLGLTGTKYGCGMALCGACTVHLDGAAVRACSLPVSAAAGKRVVTIEGLDSPVGRAVKDAWERLEVVQCGYCQPGQVMAATALLERRPQPTAEEVDAALAGNVCRCGTYVRIRAAVHAAARALGRGGVR
jgi:isoquinoline 1-oxidoreductase alpha subunit